MPGASHRTNRNRNRPHSVRFMLTFADYWSFNLYAFLRTPWLFAYLGALFTLALGLMFWEAQRHHDASMALVRNLAGSTALVTFIAAAVYFRFRGNALKVYVHNPQLADRTTVTLNDQGVRVENGADTLEVEWGLFKRIAQTRESIYLFYGLGLATIVPKRAFRSAEEAQAFYQFAREAWAEATGTTAGRGNP